MDNNLLDQCRYKSSLGNACTRSAMDSSVYCFWHDPKVDKSKEDIKEQLEKFAKEGTSMEGFQLRYADLSGALLAGGQRYTNLTEANLYRCNLEGAHLYHVDFSRATLMKANCDKANLNFSIVDSANLLAISLHDAKIEHIDWGKGLKQELDALVKYRLKEKKEAKVLYQEAEETYRTLFREYEERGIYDEAGKLFQKEMLMRRKQLKPFSKDWMVNVFSDVVTGYGEEPIRVYLLSGLLVILSTILFAFGGIIKGDEVIILSLNNSFYENLNCLWESLYFSVVTFTTLGYGDIIPYGNFSRLVAMTEAFLGSFVLAIFVVVVVKKMAR